MRLALVSLSLVCLSACGPPPLQANRAIADQVLRQSGAPDFDNVSTDERAAIRHTPSGMVCVLPRDGAFDMGVFPAGTANAGAHCSVGRDDGAAAFIVTRFAGATSLDQVFADAVSQTAGANPQRWDGQPSAADRASPTGLPHYRILRFVVQIDGAPSYLRVAVSEARGWYLQQISTAPLERAVEAEAEAGEAWRAALRDFAQPPL